MAGLNDAAPSIAITPKRIPTSGPRAVMPTAQDLVKLKVDTIYAVPEQAGLLHYGNLKFAVERASSRARAPDAPANIHFCVQRSSRCSSIPASCGIGLRKVFSVRIRDSRASGKNTAEQTGNEIRALTPLQRSPDNLTSAASSCGALADILPGGTLRALCFARHARAAVR